MGFLQRFFGAVQPAPIATRAIDSFADYPGLTEQLLAVQGISHPSRAWLYPSIREALGVPAIYRAVNLIASLGSSLALEAWRNGERMTTPPRVVARPDPFTTPRQFFFATFWDMATRGEAFWYVAARDLDGLPQSLIVVPPREVIVEWDDRRIERVYSWRNKRMTPGQLRHVPYALASGETRGSGPLQLCGAAISAAIESTEWAANFFAEGGVPSVNLHSAVDLDEGEAEAIADRWVERRGNSVRVTSGPLELRDVQISPEQAQLLQARQASVADVARMFGIPAHLLTHSQPGSSLTYQNIADVGTEFVRMALGPGYLEPVEQEFSDLLTRSTVARFNTEGLLRADIKTRWDVYEKAVAVLGPEEGADYARLHEGIDAGNPETQPVPSVAPPSLAAIPEE